MFVKKPYSLLYATGSLKWALSPNYSIELLQTVDTKFLHANRGIAKLRENYLHKKSKMDKSKEISYLKITLKSVIYSVLQSHMI